METAQSWLEPVIGFAGLLIEAIGVFAIAAGLAWSLLALATGEKDRHVYQTCKVRLGRTLLLGLEILVATDIVKTIAIAASFETLGMLGGLVLLRTFLSWTLVLEVDGRWPWQRSIGDEASKP
jgi:uncharacterized membrane protein